MTETDIKNSEAIAHKPDTHPPKNVTSTQRARANWVLIFAIQIFTQIGFGSDFNVMIIDSGFAPIKIGETTLDAKHCLLIDENNRAIPEQGPCYDEHAWQQLGQVDQLALKGYLDMSSQQKTTEAAAYWQMVQLKDPAAAKSLKSKLQLLTHGSRSASLLLRASSNLANPLLVRNISTQVGNLKNEPTTKDKHSKPKYQNGCGLTAWSDQDLKLFLEGKKLQDYQTRIANALKDNKAIKIVSLSLGYKLSWIAEDNPRCDKNQVNKEYLALQASWRNLLQMFPERVFVVAIGNEGEDFSQPSLRQNDLWGALSSLKNLLLVGSVDANKQKSTFSNFGIPSMAWEKGSSIPVQYPFPGKIEGLPAKVNGTSASAPLLAGKLLRALSTQTDPRAAIDLIRKDNQPAKWTFDSFAAACKDHGKDCLPAIYGILQDETIWSETQSWYKKINQAWYPAKLQIRLVKSERSGRQTIERQGGLTIPVIELNEADPFEMLIALNHEMHHVASLEKHISAMQQTEKVKNCMTRYQILRLEDEIQAYRSEISFWQKSPAWFKEKMLNKKFSSRLIEEKETNYEAYYKKLSAAMAKDPSFIIKRYIEMGEVAACAQDAVAAK